MTRSTFIYGAALMLLSFAGFSCSRYDNHPAEVPAPRSDEALVPVSSVANPGGESAPEQPAENAETRQVVLAGGCFWCVEAVYDQLEGVIDVESGYSGGSKETANYQAVCTGTTGHAEAVRITYDPKKITYGMILKVFFTTAHDPTTLNRQGADVGTQYRSAIFYASESQKQIAADYIKQLNEAGVFRDPIVTKLEPLMAFYPAETYHQDYAKLNPDQSYIQGVSDPKVQKTRKAYPDLLRESAPAE